MALEGRVYEKVLTIVTIFTGVTNPYVIRGGRVALPAGCQRGAVETVAESALLATLKDCIWEVVQVQWTINASQIGN